MQRRRNDPHHTSVIRRHLGIFSSAFFPRLFPFFSHLLKDQTAVPRFLTGFTSRAAASGRGRRAPGPYSTGSCCRDGDSYVSAIRGAGERSATSRSAAPRTTRTTARRPAPPGGERGGGAAALPSQDGGVPVPSALPRWREEAARGPKGRGALPRCSARRAPGPPSAAASQLSAAPASQRSARAGGRAPAGRWRRRRIPGVGGGLRAARASAFGPRAPHPLCFPPADADTFEAAEPVAKRLVPAGVAGDRWAGEDEEDDVKVRGDGAPWLGLGRRRFDPARPAPGRPRRVRLKASEPSRAEIGPRRGPVAIGLGERRRARSGQRRDGRGEEPAPGRSGGWAAGPGDALSQLCAALPPLRHLRAFGSGAAARGHRTGTPLCCAWSDLVTTLWVRV